jgi:ectoine hydroxylase-related dioxygenase (phytanoyl-CoA dioxygenase family)
MNSMVADQQYPTDSRMPEYPRDIRFGKLKTSNHLLDDREALQGAWTRDGYWYFKGVLDAGVMAEMRAVWMEYLHRHGLIDPDVDENRYNHSGFDNKALKPADLERMLEFNQRNIQKMLTGNPKINATMKRILGDDPFWLPQTEYRANAPGGDPAKVRLIYPHQDGFYSRGLDMKICWIPIDRIDLDVGGCAWVEGAHRGPLLHDLENPPSFPIRAVSLPRDGWKTATFEPGDIVIFHLNTPHSGLTNISSDRFRMSFDVRVMEASKNTPFIGHVVEITLQHVTLDHAETGERRTFALGPDTYVRSTDGKRRVGNDIPTTFVPRELIVVGSDDGKVATLVRASH